MDFRAGVVLWLAVLCLQYQISSAEPSSNCSAYRAANHDEGGGDVRESKIAETAPWCGDEQKSDESGKNYQRQIRTLADNRLPGVDGMRSMQRLPWIGGDIQKFAADLHDAKVRADAERQPTEEFHKVAESLMELLVRISENPDHWRVMTKNILQARVTGGDGDGVLPPEDKKSSADNRSDNPPPRPGRTRTPDSRRRRLGFNLNKKKKPRQKGQRQRQGQAEGQEKDADANRTDALAAGRPLTEQEARRQRLRQLAEAGVVVPTVPALPRPGAGGGRAGGGGGRGGGGGKGRRPKVAAPPTTQLPPRENQLLKQDWRNFQQQKMMWKHTRPTFEPENPGQGKVLTPIYGRYPSTTVNAKGGVGLGLSGSGGGGQKFGTLTRHAPDGPTAMTPLDKVRKMPDGPRAGGDGAGAGGGGGGAGGWDNATLSALRHGASLSRDEMVQRLLQNRPLPAELDLLSRQLGRVNKSAPEDEFGRWKQQMERLRSGPRVAVAPSPPPPPPAQPPQRFRPYALLAGEPPSAPAAAAAPWATDRAGARLPVFDYHRQPPAGKGPFASVTVPSSTDQLRGEEFPTGRLVRMRDPLEQQLVDMATSAERQSLLRRRPLAAWGRQGGVGGVGALQADPGPPQERFMTLSDIEQQLRYHTQQTNRLRKILNAAAPRRA